MCARRWRRASARDRVRAAHHAQHSGLSRPCSSCATCRRSSTPSGLPNLQVVMASALLNALFAAAGDDEEVLRRAALIIELAKLKDAASVEVFGARFFFKEEQTQPQAQHSGAAKANTPSARDTLADLMAHLPRGARRGPPLGVPPGQTRPAPRRQTQPHPAAAAHANASADAADADAVQRSERRRQRRQQRRRQRRGGPGGDHGSDTPTPATPSRPQPQSQPQPSGSGAAP